MKPKKFEGKLKSVRGNDLNEIVRPVLLGCAVLSVFVGLRAIYQFHMWDW